MKHVIAGLAFAVPAVIFLWDIGMSNNCCGETAILSPSHRLSVLAIALLNQAAYFSNRQLLVANAFEELLEQKLPGLHRPIRALYNKVGDFIHRYYGVFNNKWVADLVYVLMKPLEWVFVIVLYVADQKPENRIAQQYMDWNDRKEIKKYTR
jgi:hypothetical protein